MNANIFRSMSYGVYVVSTVDHGRPTGCIANSIMQITSSPATIAVSINHDNYTNGCISASGKFAFSILAENSDPGLIGTFGFQCGKDVNKFDSVAYEMVEGVPVVKDSCGYVVCRVIDRMETATHTVFLGEVVEGDVYEGAADAMTYAYYHKVVKGKAPKNAPTYLPEADTNNGAGAADLADRTAEAGGQACKKESTRKWVCQVCGYVYEGDELPADFTCPICKHGADQFKLVEA